MKRRTMLLALVVIAVAGGLGYATLSSESRTDEGASITPQEVSVIENQPLEPLDACSADEAGSTTSVAASCSRCPDYWPKCSRDRDCDSVCGGKGTGVCEWINSCSKCCTCAGTT